MIHVYLLVIPAFSFNIDPNIRGTSYICHARRASSIASLSPRRAGRRSWWGWWGPRFVVPVRKIRARWSLRIFLGHGWEIQPTNDGLMIWLLISVMVHYCVPKPQNNCESLEMMAHYCVPRFLGEVFSVSFNFNIVLNYVLIHFSFF